MQWSFSGERPVYQQIMEHMRAAVLAGEYPAGSRIPSVRELAAMARVNPNTMQRAMTELEREGLLVCGGTIGRSVTEDTAVLERIRSDFRQQVVRRCARMLEELGLTLEEAAALQRQWDQETKEV